jgi:hypothetical protein
MIGDVGDLGDSVLPSSAMSCDDGDVRDLGDSVSPMPLLLPFANC